MAKEYQYRPHIRWFLYYVIPLITGIGIALTWLVIVFLSVIKKGSFEDLMLDGISLSGLFLLQAVIFGYLFYRLTVVRVSISDGGINYKHHSGNIQIRPEEITKIQFPSLPYMGGWIKIIAGSKTIRLTVVVEAIGDFLKELKELLDQSGNAHRYDRKKFFGFLKTATYADQSWARLYSFFGVLIMTIIVLVVAALSLGLFADIPMIWLALLVMASPLWPLGAWIVCELRLARKFAKGASEEGFFCPPRDPVYERTLFHRGLLMAGMVYGLIFIGFMIPRLFG